MRVSVLAACFLLMVSWAEEHSGGKVVDLGHPLSESSPTWAGEKVYGRTAMAEVDKDGYGTGKFFSDEHFGTHVDAPSHFSDKGWSVDQIPVERLVGPGVCISVVAQVEASEDYRVTPADVRTFEAEHGVIPEESIVLIATGWDRYWDEPVRYMNDRDGVKHFPGISVEAAAYLATERRVAGIVIDTPSVDYGPSTKFETHQVTLPHNVFHVESATHLTELPAIGFTVVVAPINLQGGTGGPTRLFALLD